MTALPILLAFLMSISRTIIGTSDHEGHNSLGVVLDRQTLAREAEGEIIHTEALRSDVIGLCDDNFRTFQSTFR